MASYTLKEVAQREHWMVIHGKVYDVTTFLTDHPGGEEVLVEASGRDASVDFDNVAHSPDAHELMAKYYVGELVDNATGKGSGAKTSGGAKKEGGPSVWIIVVPILIVGVAIALRFYQ